MADETTGVQFVPVFNDEGFLVGVYKKDDSDHHHYWTFSNGGESAVCAACQLHIRIYTVQEAIKTWLTQKT